MEDRIEATVAASSGEWAGVLRAVDSARLRELPADKRRIAERRLALLRLWADRDTAIPSVEAAIAAARLSRARFFGLVKRLRGGGFVELDELGLYLSRKADRERGDEPMVEAASRLLVAKPGIGTAELVAGLEAVFDGAARTTLYRAIDQARRSAPPTAPFGAAMQFDSAGIDLVDLEGRRLRLFALIDLGTGLIPAWALLPELDFAAAYRTVAEIASSDTTRWCGQRPPSLGTTAPGDMRVSISAPLAVDAGFRREVADRGIDIAADPRRTGRALVAALGGDVARIALFAGFANEGARHRNRTRIGLPAAGPVTVERIGRGLREHAALRSGLLAAGDDDPDPLVAVAARRLLG